MFVAYDKDTSSSDLLGQTKPIGGLTDFEGRVKHEVEILDSNSKMVGTLKFTSELHWVDYIPAPTICDSRS